MKLLFKRAFELVGAVTIFVVVLPVLVVAAILVLLEDGRPVLFTQTRAGKHGKPFRLFKLRTMRQNTVPPDEMGTVGNDHPLNTRVGRFLRRSKIDELPQLVNVMRGELSFVGPRPTLLEQVEGYDWFEKRRLEVNPGITGWAQVNGNVSLPWHTRIALDVWYVDHRSLKLDIAILMRTARTVVSGEQPNSDVITEATTYADSVGWRGWIV